MSTAGGVCWAFPPFLPSALLGERWALPSFGGKCRFPCGLQRPTLSVRYALYLQCQVRRDLWSPGNINGYALVEREGTWARADVPALAYPAR